MNILSDWIEPASEKYNVTIVVVTGMDWESVFSPWQAKGVPAGSADFKGKSPEFLKLLQQELIPAVETKLGVGSEVERTLVGVSMSGLFALGNGCFVTSFKILHPSQARSGMSDSLPG